MSICEFTMIIINGGIDKYMEKNQIFHTEFQIQYIDTLTFDRGVYLLPLKNMDLVTSFERMGNDK